MSSTPPPSTTATAEHPSQEKPVTPEPQQQQQKQQQQQAPTQAQPKAEPQSNTPETAASTSKNEEASTAAAPLQKESTAARLNANARAFVPTPASGEAAAAAAAAVAGGPPNATHSQPQKSPLPPPPQQPQYRYHVPPMAPMMLMPGMPGMGAHLGMPGMMPGMIPGMMFQPGMMMPSPVYSPNAHGVVPSPNRPPTMPTRGGSGGIPASAEIPTISVGNAALKAIQKNQPPKFACVLLIGLPSSGKTTTGAQLVRELNEEQLKWEYFTGSSFIKEPIPGHRQPSWETTKDVLDALAAKIDALIAKQAKDPIRGLVIDKNVKGIEDIYYVSGLLKKKERHLSGIVAFDTKNTQALIDRLGGGDEAKEKFKYYRVILAKIQDNAKSTNLYHTIDPTKSREDTVVDLRVQVLGSSAIENPRQLSPACYGDCSCEMVDDYVEYAHVMNAVCQYTRPPKQHQFPGHTNYTPISNKLMHDRKFKTSLKEENYRARRKADGSKFVLYHENTKLYLVPRHMRAVLRIPSDSWLGTSLADAGPFVLDGELVRLAKDSKKEKFIVYDVLFWAEKGSTANICRGTYLERQAFLDSRLCAEQNSFFQPKTDILVVHQGLATPADIPKLLTLTDYHAEGIVLQPTARGDDPVYLWRPPQAISVDFRLGAATFPTTSAAAGTSPSKEGSEGRHQHQSNNSVKVHYELELFDRAQNKIVPYTRYGGVEITFNNRPPLVEGTIVSCGLQANDDDTIRNAWHFFQVRYDVLIPATKSNVDDLLDDCLITKEKFLQWLYSEKIAVPESVPVPTTSAAVLAAVTSSDQPALGSAAPITNTVPPNMSGRTAVNTRGSEPIPGNLLGPRTALEVLKGKRMPPPPHPMKQPIPYNEAVSAMMSTFQHPPPSHQPPHQAPPQAEQAHTDHAHGRGKRGPNAAQKPNTSPAPQPRHQDPHQQPAANTPQAAATATATATAAATAAPAQESKRGRKKKAKQHNDEAGAGDAAEDNAIPKRRCGDCKREKRETDGCVDKNDRGKRFFCFLCWAKTGTEHCAECGAFAKGHREPAVGGGRQKAGSFLCEACWAKRKGKEGNAGNDKEATKDADGEKGSEEGEAKKKRRRRGGRGKKKAESGTEADNKTATPATTPAAEAPATATATAPAASAAAVETVNK